MPRQELPLELDFQIISSHIAHQLSRDKEALDSTASNIQNAALSLAFSQLQRSLEQSNTVISCIRNPKNIDISSVMNILRSLYEILTDFNYIFSINIFKKGFEDKNLYEEQIKFKLTLHEIMGIAALKEFYALAKTDIYKNDKLQLLTTEFDENIEHHREYIKNFRSETLISSTYYKKDTNLDNEAIKKFEHIQKKIDDESWLSKNTHRHRLLNQNLILNLRGFHQDYLSLYSYLSDFAHVGKMSLFEYSIRNYEQPGSLTLRTVYELILFMQSQFYLEYLNFRHRYGNQNAQINKEYSHQATVSKIDVIETLNYWINFYRSDDFKDKKAF